MKKFLVSSAFVATIALFVACGDDSSSGPEEESSSSIAAEGESSSSEETSSSSNFTNTSSSQNAVASSSSSAIASCSSANGSSSSEEVSSCSSSSVIASSSSAKQSSSSEAVAEVKPSGTYDCDVYNCVSTTYLKSGITYGEILDTRDDQVYKVVTIGSGTSAQTWMAQNLNYAYNYGTAMSYCYDGDCSTYGRLYLWSAAMDSAKVFSSDDEGCGYGKTCSPSGSIRGVCPSGWHLPSYGDFETLINNIDSDFGYGHTENASSSTAGHPLKATSGWNDGGNGDDTYGFSALPAGYYDAYGESFVNVVDEANFWSSTEYDSYDAYHLFLYYECDDAFLSWSSKSYARSVRCLKDN